MFVECSPAYDADDLMYGLLVARDGLEYHHPVEFEYYSNPKLAAALASKLCIYVYRVGSSRAEGFVNEDLNLEWKSVLPMYLDCRGACALPLARIKRRNGDGNEHRSHRARLAASVARQASHEEVIAPVDAGGAVASVEPGIDILAIAPHGARRRRVLRHPKELPATRSRKARSRRE